MFKKAIRIIVFVLIISLLISAFAGCKCKKNISGAAEEYVKSSSTDKTESGASEDNTGNTSSSGKSGKKSDGSGSSDSSGETVTSDVDSGSGDNSSTVSSGSDGETTLFGIPIDSEPIKGDQGPVVVIKK